MRSIIKKWPILRSPKLKELEKDEKNLLSSLDQILDFSENKNADVLLSYAHDNFVELKLSAETIEKKADDLIKYLGIGTALLGYVGANLSKYLSYDPYKWVLLAGIVLWAISLFLALLTRKPASYLYPDSIYTVYDILNEKGYTENSAKTILLLSYEKARISHYYRGRHKARILNWSYICLFFSLLLILAFIMIILL